MSCISNRNFLFGTEESFEVIDWLGNWDGDPGSGWDVAGVSNGTKDHVLVRKCDINIGNTNWSSSAGTDSLNSEWTVLSNEDWSDIGQHTNPCTSLDVYGCTDSTALNYNPSATIDDGSCLIISGGCSDPTANNYSGDVTSTDWTTVNDVLECEINDNGTVFTGTPYPGDQSGPQPPNGVKDPNNSPNNLWIRAELNLEDYKTESAFTIAFRLKTYFDTTPNCPVNGIMKIANVHFVATEK